MTAVTVDAIAEAGYEIGLDVKKRSYSGRAMYGEKTQAIVCSDIADFVLMVSVASRHLNDTEAEEFDADLRRMRTDSLGHDIVVY